ncbi:FAD-dependent monooxygenase [Candidatus Blochmannia ocreatus (nom. nud.)]|uniref:FAD-dependent monooxygenase n=1 Tax=Candidatus Blochmannia ocreatus (nom. nud.) TaxID=251538 RepID=A0ABY4STM4_9ENTR|nr:FAD-dependent monooxygenase [Candidatus Blochmannia ocreatus]URJ25325.1 FAD-dependent monooxygenase [Candidatus Blochmannia ocreatus]
MKNFDILIINKGIAGLALACGLKNYFRIAIIEHKLKTHINPVSKLLNVKTSVLINITSAKILSYLNTWNKNTTYPYNIISKLEITQNYNTKKIIFNSGHLGYPELGYISDYNHIYNSLIKEAQKSQNIFFINTKIPNTINYYKDAALIEIKNYPIFKVKLVIGSDGINSWTRKNANFPLIFKDKKYYEFHTTIYTEKQHKNTLRYISHDNSLLILLPLNHTNLSAVFWLLPTNIGIKYFFKNISKEHINSDLTKICAMLGHCYIYNDIPSYKIFLPRIQYAYKFVQSRLILIGNAAYTISPFPFQDINIELIEAITLLNYLKKLKKNNKDIGHYTYLKDYEYHKKYQIFKYFTKLSNIFPLSQRNNYISLYTQNFMFNIIQTIPSLKTNILNQIMGLDVMPTWLL